MKCKKVKKIILTDYIDNQINFSLKEVVEKHLKVCKDCKDFFTSLKKALDKLDLKQLEFQFDKDRLFCCIEEKLKKHEVDKGFIFHFDFNFILKRIAPLLVGFCILILVTLHFVLREKLVYEFFDDQFNFFDQLYSKKSFIDYNGLGVEIENYLF